MAKIVICSEKKINVDAMIEVLSEEHQVIFCDPASSEYTENHLSEFDLIMDFMNSKEHRACVIKKCFENGTPVIVGGQSYTSPGSIAHLGIASYTSESHSKRSYNVNNLDVTLSARGKREIMIYNQNNRQFYFYHGSKSSLENMSPLLVFDSVSGYYRLPVTCATFKKGDLNMRDEPFAADCAFLGFDFNVQLTNDAINIVNDVVSWLLNKTYVPAKVKNHDGTLLSDHDVYLHFRESGDLIAKYKSDEKGSVAFRIRHKCDYYAVAFDKKGGMKNAVAIDNIIA